MARRTGIDARLLSTDIQPLSRADRQSHMHGDPVDTARATRSLEGRQSPLGTPRYPDVVGLHAHEPPVAHTAWVHALYGYGYADSELPHLKSLLATKRGRRWRAPVQDWPSIVLDAAGVEIALVNTVRPGAGQTSGRFRWVPCMSRSAAAALRRRETQPAAVLGG